LWKGGPKNPFFFDGGEIEPLDTVHLSLKKEKKLNTSCQVRGEAQIN
jgi:hypothetical protein